MNLPLSAVRETAREGLGNRYRASGAADCEFGINGRFLSQPLTGVQRYGREIVGALDSLVAEKAHSIKLIIPNEARQSIDLRNIEIKALGVGRGHAWEQSMLPLRHSGLLLNLCNTAPALGNNRVVCIHDANVFLAAESYSRSFRVFYKMLQPLISRRSTFVTTVSEDAASKISDHLNVARDRIKIAPNGHEHALRWDASRSKLRDMHGFRRPYIVLLGSLAKHKNIGRIMGLSDKLDSIGMDIKIIGGSTAIFHQEQWRAAPNVAFLGRVSDDDLAFLLANALCLAFPSTSEGFGIPLLEAMVCGCPIVASNSSSLPQVCGNAALLADPHDDEQWLKHFVALAESELLCRELSGKGREQVQRFSWRSSAQIYLELMGSNG
jgi:glycosyltransferase involved in cell wall biosynthesis